MDKTLKMLQPAMLRYLQAHFSEAEAQKRWQQIEHQYHAWVTSEGDLGGSRNLMASNMLLCYGMCAFYDAVDRNFSGEDLDKLVHEVMKVPFGFLAHLDMNRLHKKTFLTRLIYRFARRYEKKSRQYRGNRWGNTWKVKINPDNKESGLAGVLYTCPLYEFARKYGYMDLLPSLCAVDHLMASKFHARLIRHYTLASGGPYCDYWYVGDHSPEAETDRAAMQKLGKNHP